MAEVAHPVQAIPFRDVDERRRWKVYSRVFQNPGCVWDPPKQWLVHPKTIVEGCLYLKGNWLLWSKWIVYGRYEHVPILGAMWHISRQLDTIMEMKAWRCNLTCSKSPAMQWRCMYDSVYAKRERKASCLKIPLTQLSFMVMLQQSWNILTACFWTESFPPPTQCCVIVATTHHILSWWPSLEIILATYHPTHSIRPLVQWWWKNWIDFGGNKIPTISSTSFFVTYKSGLITINVNDLCERRRGVT